MFRITIKFQHKTNLTNPQFWIYLSKAIIALMLAIHLNYLIYMHGVTMWQIKILLTPLHFILSIIAKATAFQVPTAQNTMIVLLTTAVLMLLRLTLLLKLIKVSIFVHLLKAIGSSLITCKDCISMALLIILLYIHILVYRLL